MVVVLIVIFLIIGLHPLDTAIVVVDVDVADVVVIDVVCPLGIGVCIVLSCCFCTSFCCCALPIFAMPVAHSSGCAIRT